MTNTEAALNLRSLAVPSVRREQDESHTPADSDERLVHVTEASSLTQRPTVLSHGRF
jgi:hypothetical protein